jgi:transformation/transcription domain-associated protein
MPFPSVPALEPQNSTSSYYAGNTPTPGSGAANPSLPSLPSSYPVATPNFIAGAPVAPASFLNTQSGQQLQPGGYSYPPPVVDANAPLPTGLSQFVADSSFVSTPYAPFQPADGVNLPGLGNVLAPGLPQSSSSFPLPGSTPGSFGANPNSTGTSPEPANGTSSANPARREREDDPTQPLAVQWVENVVNVLRRSHSCLMTEVERMLDEFSRRFKPEPEEELLGAVHALILKCFKQPLTPCDSVPAVLTTTIDRVCRKFFTPDLGGNNKKHLAFVHKYKEAFERDFLPPQAGRPSRFPPSLTELLHRLKRWKYHLQYRVGSRSQTNLKLERLSPYLIRFRSYDIEIPGQYVQDVEPNVDRNVILQRFEPEVQVHHSHGFSHRRIGLMGDDGKVVHFLVQYSISHITRSDERMMQLYVLLNRMMSKSKETRRRNLVFHVPLVIPLTHRLRLMETHTAHVSLEEVYEQSCVTRDVDADKPLLLYREVVRKAEGCERSSHARLKVMSEVCNTIIPDYVLARYLHRTIPAPDQLWAFKKEFGAQLALCGFLSYIMKIGERALHKMSFFKHSARMINSEFYPVSTHPFLTPYSPALA